MARKVFQDFAHVLCQKFVEVPSNGDLLVLAVLGSGKLELDLTGGRHRHNRAPIAPLPYVEVARSWLGGRMAELDIPVEEMAAATLIVEYSVTLSRKEPLLWLSAAFDFSCTGVIDALDRQYTSTLKSHKEWGLYPQVPIAPAP